MEWLNFRHLYAFWAICRYGGFKRAADKIFVSQSTVSEQVAELESYLEEELLERSTRSVKVTERGAELLRYADTIFASSAHINQVFRDKASAAQGTHIRVGMVGGVSRNFLFGLIAHALDAGGETHVDVVDGSFDELTQLLRGFELDLVFSLEPPRSKDRLTVTHQRVAVSPLCLVGDPSLIRKVTREHKRPLPVELYLFRHRVEGRPVAERVAERFNLEVTVPVSTDDISLLRFLANGGRGLAVLPAIGVHEDVSAGRVAQVPLPRGPRVEVFAVYLTQGVRQGMVDTFLAPLKHPE